MTDALLDVEVRGHDLSLFSVWRQLVKHDRINELDVNTTFIKKHLVHTHTHVVYKAAVARSHVYP